MHQEIIFFQYRDFFSISASLALFPALAALLRIKPLLTFCQSSDKRITEPGGIPGSLRNGAQMVNSDWN